MEDYTEEAQGNCEECEYADECDGICHILAFRLEELNERKTNG